jgi:hypothetical protein
LRILLRLEWSLLPIFHSQVRIVSGKVTDMTEYAGQNVGLYKDI